MIKCTYNCLILCEKLLDIYILQNLLKLTYHENHHIINNLIYLFNNALSQDNRFKAKILQSIELKERVCELFKILSSLPNFLIESLFILIGNFHIKCADEKLLEMNKSNFNYVNIKNKLVSIFYSKFFIIFK